ncbi:unnamed protein product [Schistosoma mattheei]|uniref:Uncharacterized protein n=1 Tax=Schistosoma mattheei TaxID=31246 RepID=A0A183Q2N9_9TREM|nr:unnamed protein product [Schistosoma mattheei]
MNQYLHYDQYTLSSQEVEVQLDILNKTSTQINDLERRLEISRDVYRKVLSDQSDKLQKLSKKLGKCIIRTRPYNELKQKQAHYRKEIQMAALKYENAISTLSAARDTLAKLEACVSEPGVRDPNLLESLNQSITDVSLFYFYCGTILLFYSNGLSYTEKIRVIKLKSDVNYLKISVFCFSYKYSIYRANFSAK